MSYREILKKLCNFFLFLSLALSATAQSSKPLDNANATAASDPSATATQPAGDAGKPIAQAAADQPPDDAKAEGWERVWQQNNPAGQQNNTPQPPTIGQKGPDYVPPVRPYSAPGTAPTSDPKLTYFGVTLYGNVDIGAEHLDHTATYNGNAFQTGFGQVIVKTSNHAATHYAQNGLSMSVIGISGNEHLYKGASLVFRLSPAFEPLDLKWTNSLQALVSNDGVAQQNQSSSGDTNRAGKVNNGEAYIGFTVQGDKKSAALTFGRNNNVFFNSVITHDFAQGFAFSLLNYIGLVNGVGDPENLAEDGSLKFAGTWGRYHINMIGQFPGCDPVFRPSCVHGSDTQGGVGVDIGRLQLDLDYGRTRDSISSLYLTAAQQATLPVAQRNTTLAGTISDNHETTVFGKYSIDKHERWTLDGGFGRVNFANPRNPLNAGITTEGGYILSVLTQNAYTVNKKVLASWFGTKYFWTRKLSTSGGFYKYHQENYVGGGNTCSDGSNLKCSGSLNVITALGVYSISYHYDLYLGTQWSLATGGYSSGYLYTHTDNTMAGVRFHF